MIAIMGDACLSLYEKEDGDFRCEVSGYGYRVAKNIAENGLFPALFCSLGSDKAGSLIVERLVEDEILFDPDIVRLPFKTNVCISFSDGSVSDFHQYSASALLNSQSLQSALSVHTNIKAVHLSSRILSFNPSSSAVIDQVLFLSPRPFIVVDLNEKAEGPVAERGIETLCPYTDLFIVKEDSASDTLLNESKLVLLRRNEGVDVYRMGERVNSYSLSKDLSDDSFSASIMVYLERSGFLPSDGEDISRYDLTDDFISEMLGAL